MSQLRDRIKSLDDADLISDRFEKTGSFSEEALAFMDEEIARRGLAVPLAPSAVSEIASEEEPITEEIVKLPAGFTIADAPILRSIFMESEIPFTISDATNTDTLPLESETEAHFVMWVPQSRLDEATQIVHEHFDNLGHVYVRKGGTIREMLASFDFADVHFTPSAMEEIIDAEFTKDESAALVKLLVRLRDDVDAVEEKLGRFLFHYDNLDHCENRLVANNAGYSRADFLAMLEVMQAYADDPEFPEQLDSVAKSLIELFSGV